MVIHDIADQLNLIHESKGEKKQRYIQVRKKVVVENNNNTKKEDDIKKDEKETISKINEQKKESKKPKNTNHENEKQNIINNEVIHRPDIFITGGQTGGDSVPTKVYKTLNIKLQGYMPKGFKRDDKKGRQF
eukprot:UN33814